MRYIILAVGLFLLFPVVAKADQPGYYYTWLYDSSSILSMSNGQSVDIPSYSPNGFGTGRVEVRQVGAVADWNFGHTGITGYTCAQTLCAMGIFLYHANPDPPNIYPTPGTLRFSNELQTEAYDGTYEAAFAQSSLAFQAGVDSFLEEPTLIRPLFIAFFALLMAMQLIKGVRLVLETSRWGTLQHGTLDSNAQQDSTGETNAVALGEEGDKDEGGAE